MTIDAAKAAITPALRRYVKNDKYSGIVIRHPLVYGSLFSHETVNAANRTFATQTEIIREALAAGDFETAVLAYQRPYRLRALAKHISMPVDQYWRLVGFVYTDSEYPDRDLFRLLFGRKPLRRDLLMSETDHQTYLALPETVQIYRGCSRHRGSDLGLSW